MLEGVLKPGNAINLPVNHLIDGVSRYGSTCYFLHTLMHNPIFSVGSFLQTNNFVWDSGGEDGKSFTRQPTKQKKNRIILE